MHGVEELGKPLSCDAEQGENSAKRGAKGLMPVPEGRRGARTGRQAVMIIPGSMTKLLLAIPTLKPTLSPRALLGQGEPALAEWEVSHGRFETGK